MSILAENIEPEVVLVGHMFDIANRTYKHGFSNFYDESNNRFSCNWQGLKGLFGFRQSHLAYVRQLERYIVAAFMTCYMNPDGIHVYDDRFNKLIRIINKVYGLPMGTLEVEFDLNRGVLKMWGKCQRFSLYNSIIDFKIVEPQVYRGIGWPNGNVRPALATLDRAYYACKPQAIKTHLMYMERLLNYDVENDILTNN